jgi:hypothetical protein
VSLFVSLQLPLPPVSAVDKHQQEQKQQGDLPKEIAVKLIRGQDQEGQNLGLDLDKGTLVLLH